MKMLKSVLSFTLSVAVAISGSDAEGSSTWSYSDPGQWSDTYANCGGTQQSPINIDRFDMNSGGVPQIEFHNYGTMPEIQSVTNDGHTVKVSISSTTDAPYIAWGGWWIFPGSQYNFAQFHLHWGSKSSQGSEHTIDTVRYPMELHLVHYNNVYSDIGAAVTESDGLAVLGIMFVISTNDNPALDPLVEAIQEVSDYTSDDTTVDKTNVLYALGSLLPSDTENFYRYKGSLTTPTCDESVLWTVFAKPVEISEAQIAIFRSVVGASGSSSDNFRPVQPLNDRRVTAS